MVARYDRMGVVADGWVRWMKCAPLVLEVEEGTDGQVAGEVGWGEAVEGVRVGLRAKKAIWQGSEYPVFTIDLESEEERTLPHYGPPIHAFEVMVDGKWYERTSDFFEGLKSVGDSSGKERELHFSLAAKHWRRKDDGARMSLRGGRHVLRVAYLFSSAEGGNAELVRAISNPVEIEILPTFEIELLSRVELDRAERTWKAEVRRRAAEEVRVELRGAVQVWGRSDWADSVVRLTVDARNDGAYRLHLPRNGQSWQVEVDGVWYERVENPGGVLLDFASGDRHEGLTVEVAGGWRRIPEGKELEYARRWYGSGFAVMGEQYGEALQLGPGEHRVRVAITCPPSRAGQDIVAIRSVSNPVEIEIVAGEEGVGEESWGEAVEGLAARLRPEKQTITKGKKGGLRLDLRNDRSEIFPASAFYESVWLEVDGRWYCSKNNLGTISAIEIEPGGTAETFRKLILQGGKNELWTGGWSEVTPPYEYSWRHLLSKPLFLANGSHAIRVGFIFPDRAHNGHVRAVSNLVQVAVDREVDESTLNTLIERMWDEVSSERYQAVEALGDMGPDAHIAASALIRKLKERDIYFCTPIARALWQIAPVERVVPALVETLKYYNSPNNSRINDHDTYRTAIGVIMGVLAAIGDEATPALAQALKDGAISPLVFRYYDLDYGPAAARVSPALVRLLDDEDDEVRIRAIRALEHIRQEDAVPGLIRALKDENTDVRRAATTTIGWFDGRAREAVPALVEALKDENRDVRVNAIGALDSIFNVSEFDSVAPDVIPLLLEALKDKNTSVRAHAAGALGGIGHKANVAVPALIEALKDEEAEVRRSAAKALGRIGPGAKEAAPVLIETLRDDDLGVRLKAIRALANVGLEAAEVFPALGQQMKDEDDDIRLSTIEALQDIGPAAKVAVPALMGALKDENERVRYRAAEALGAIGPDAKEAVLALIETLSSDSAQPRVNAAKALGEIGPAAREAVPALIHALEDTESGVQSYSHWALEHITGKKFPRRDPAKWQDWWEKEEYAAKVQVEGENADGEIEGKEVIVEVLGGLV